ncbi:hypothetical protein OnM2_098028 [Erysiphe neolycopersici]|uniref:Uncharacterized protein n=1 Tax=Erysiphe neolycopersici TaxID=212602 RepID=A0A420HAH0_9PEZI|nr:hypothetical protein OnM2_098028 [Erysiphe neolycopersici]
MQDIALLLAFLTATSVVAQKPYGPPPVPSGGPAALGANSGKNSTKLGATASSPSAALSTGSPKGGASGSTKTNDTIGSPAIGPTKATQTAGVVGPLSQSGGLVSLAGLGIAFAVFM